MEKNIILWNQCFKKQRLFQNENKNKGLKTNHVLLHEIILSNHPSLSFIIIDISYLMPCNLIVSYKIAKK